MTSGKPSFILSSMSDTVRIWCLLFDPYLPKKNIGEIFSVSCTREADIDDLKCAVKKEWEDDPELGDVDPDNLMVWRGKDPTLDTENACIFIKSIDFCNDEVVEALCGIDELAPLKLRENEVLLVERPGMSCDLWQF